MFEIFKKYVGLNDGVISNSPEDFLSSVEGNILKWNVSCF